MSDEIFAKWGFTLETEDLKLLFQAEKEFVETLKTNFSLFIHDSKFAYLDAVDFKNDETSDYVH